MHDSTAARAQSRPSLAAELFQQEVRAVFLRFFSTEGWGLLLLLRASGSLIIVIIFIIIYLNINGQGGSFTINYEWKKIIQIYESR